LLTGYSEAIIKEGSTSREKENKSHLVEAIRGEKGAKGTTPLRWLGENYGGQRTKSRKLGEKANYK